MKILLLEINYFYRGGKRLTFWTMELNQFENLEQLSRRQDGFG
jgi:hypothetical protein